MLWGDSDRNGDPDYGRAFAAARSPQPVAIPGAQFQLLPATGHFPRLETPDQVLRKVWAFTGSHTTNCPARCDASAGCRRRP